MCKGEKIRLKDIVAYEKSQMLTSNFTVSYILTPIYLIISFLLIAVCVVLMEIDDETYLVPGLLCLGAFVLISILFLATVPVVRKKVIEAELARYDFDASKIEASDTWDFSTDELALKFDKYGMSIDGTLHYYNHLLKQVVTGNHYKRVEIYLMFAFSEAENVILNVNPTTLKMLTCLNITLDNQHILDYILSNKWDAFRQIYDKGYVTLPANGDYRSAG